MSNFKKQDSYTPRELQLMINGLRTSSNRAEILDWMLRAAKLAGTHDLYIYLVATHNYKPPIVAPQVAPQPPITPYVSPPSPILTALKNPTPLPTPPALAEDDIGWMLMEVWNAQFKFPGRLEPDMLLDFCAPWSNGIPGRRYSTFSEHQKSTFGLICGDWRRDCKLKGITPFQRPRSKPALTPENEPGA